MKKEDIIHVCIVKIDEFEGSNQEYLDMLNELKAEIEIRIEGKEFEMAHDGEYY